MLGQFGVFCNSQLPKVGVTNSSVVPNPKHGVTGARGVYGTSAGGACVQQHVVVVSAGRAVAVQSQRARTSVGRR